MANSEVIKEFLVGLGFKVDPKSLKSFEGGLASAGKAVFGLAAAVETAALAIGAGVAAFAAGMDTMYFKSQRVGASVTGMKAAQYAATQLGASVQDASSAFEGLAKFSRENPASESFLKTLGVQTRDVNGKIRDTSDVMADLGKEFAKKPWWMAVQQAKLIGIDENMLRVIQSGDFSKFSKDYQDMAKNANLDKSSEDAKKFMNSLRGVTAQFGLLGDQVLGALQEKAGPQLEKFKAWFVEHGPYIAEVIALILNKIMQLAEFIGGAVVAAFNGWYDIIQRIDLGAWSEPLSDLLDSLGKIAGAIKLAFGPLVSAMITTTLQAAIDSFKVLVDLVVIAADVLTGKWGKALEHTRELGKDIGQGAKNLGHNLTRKDWADAPKEGGASGSWGNQAAKSLEKWKSTEQRIQAGVYSALGNLIGRGEGGYNSYNSGTKGVAGDKIGYSGKKDLSNMTLNEILASGRSGNGYNKDRIFAAGKYQVVTDDKFHTGGTLGAAMRKMGLSGNEKFTPEMQEKMFAQALLPKAAKDYVDRKTTNLQGALVAMAQQWRSVADPRTGMTYADSGAGANRASISAQAMAAQLNNARLETMSKPLGSETQTSTNSGPVAMSQSTTIHVQGGGDPASTGRAVAAEQNRVNSTMQRNLQTAVM